MKNNIFGFIFFVFIIIIMSFAIYKVNYKENKQEETNVIGKQTSISTTRKGTSLTLGISEFDSINPIITRNRKVQDIDKLIFESLVKVGKDGRLEPCLAKEWKVIDNVTYIVKLNTDIEWSDGSYFNSVDVQYSINRLKEADNFSIYSENVRNVKEVDIVDNSTLRIILSEEVPFFEYYLTFPIVSSKYFSGEDFWNTEKNIKPISTGRFKISEVNNNSITLIKNDAWWNIENDNSVIEKINVNLYSSVAELYNAFKLGSIDLIATENINFPEYIGKIGYNVKEIEGRNFLFLALNTNNIALSDINVRRAIRCAINKDEIVSKFYGNAYQKADFPIVQTNYLVDYTNESKFNISEIETNLKKGEWSIRNGVWSKNIDYKTVRLEFNMVVKKDSDRIEIAKYIKDFCLGNGIIINIIEAQEEEYLAYLQNREYDMVLCEITQSITPDLTTFFGKNNLANFSSQQLEETMMYLNNITDENELKLRFQNLYQIYDTEVPYIGIARNNIFVITNSYLNAQIDSKWYDLFFNFKDWYTS